MIISQIKCGIGNQLFRYAMGRRLAHKWNAEFKIDISEYKANKFRSCILDNFNITATLASPEEIERLQRLREGTNLGKEKKSWYFWSEVLDYPDDLYVNGAWEDERYFADISDIIRKEFTLKVSLSTEAQYWKEKILASECSVSLHFRHGDFAYSPFIKLFPSNAILPFDYYYNCINILKQSYPNLTLFVFSNNLQWIKENLRVDLPVDFVEGENLKDFEELYLMSLCKHNIIANSTFSWWAAWLNQNPDKKVFMPIPSSDDAKIGYRYSPIRNENSSLDSDKWIRIPFDVNAKPSITMRPWFSLLLVMNNDAAQIIDSLNSILRQNYEFFELIIVDNASTDDSGKICKQVIKDHDNVTLIKLYNKVQNGAAWNIALKAAQGYYVLFLKSNDRLLINTLSSSYLINENAFSNIVNSLAYLREDKGGNIDIDDKKFILEKESSFQSFQGILKIKLSTEREDNNNGEQLLRLKSEEDIPNVGKVFSTSCNKSTLLKILSNDGVVLPLQTRIFKRKFLMENKIEFNEKIKDDAELLFTLDAMFQTDEILFASNVFYVAPSVEQLPPKKAGDS